MQFEFDNETLLLRDIPAEVPYAEWDDRVEEYRAQTYRYRTLLEWASAWDDIQKQATLQQDLLQGVDDQACSYPDLALEPALDIEPWDYQQAALDA